MSVPQSNLYGGVPVNYQHADAGAAITAAEAAKEHRRGRVLTGLAAGFHSSAAIAALIGALTPTATVTIPAADDMITQDAYLYQFVSKIDGASTTTAYTSDSCLYPLPTAALTCACVATAANALLMLLVLWRARAAAAGVVAPSHTSPLLIWLLGLGAVGSSVAAVACAAAFYGDACLGPSLHSAGYTLSVGFSFLVFACAAGLVALILSACSLRHRLSAAQQQQPVSMNTPLTKNAV